MSDPRYTVHTKGCAYLQAVGNDCDCTENARLRADLKKAEEESDHLSEELEECRENLATIRAEKEKK